MPWSVSRLLSVLGRLFAVAGAALSVATVAWGWLIYFSECPPACEGLGILPLVNLVQVIVAAWVVWSVIRPGSRSLIRVLLLAFAATFLLGYGWYYLLAGEGGELIGVGDLLYLLAALLVFGGDPSAHWAPAENDRP